MSNLDKSFRKEFKMIKVLSLFFSITTFTVFAMDNHSFALTDSHLVELESLVEKNEKSESLKKIENLSTKLNQDHDFHKRNSDHKLMIDHAISEFKKISEAIKKDEKKSSLNRLKIMKDWLKAQK